MLIGLEVETRKHDNHAMNDMQPSCSTSNKIYFSEAGPYNEEGKKSVKNVSHKQGQISKGNLTHENQSDRSHEKKNESLQNVRTDKDSLESLKNDEHV